MRSSLAMRQEILDAFFDGIQYSSMHSHQAIYMFDYQSDRALYISPACEILLNKCGALKVFELTYNIFLEQIVCGSTGWIHDANTAAINFFKCLSTEEYRQYILSYNFYLKSYNSSNLVCHRLTPIQLTDTGNVHWLLGSFSLSSHNTIGHIRISKSGSSVYWKYSENERKWTEKKGIILSNLEKKIILLSAQGVQEQEIAKMLHISTPLLKFRKRELFIRLKVNNISKTILRAINYHLL